MYASHYRLTCSGTLGTGASAAEKFSFGLCLAKATATGSGGDGTADGTLQPDDNQMTDLVTDTVAFFGRAGSLIASHAILKEIKLATIGADGKYVSDPKIAVVNQAGGGGSTIVHPAQIACAVSLTTGRRGATGRGRFYLPAPAMSVSASTLQWTPAQTNGVRDSVVTWLDALNNEPNVDVLNWGVCVASTKGYNTAVTGVRVGIVPDTVRSRRTSISESYSSITALAANS